MGALLRLLVQMLTRLGSRGAVVVGRVGRVAFGGLIRNQPFHQLTQQQIRNALKDAGLREAHNAHFISRLVERGPSFGMNTLDDLARAMNNGIARAGRDGTVEIVIPNGRAAIIVNRLGELVTLTGL